MNKTFNNNRDAAEGVRILFCNVQSNYRSRKFMSQEKTSDVYVSETEAERVYDEPIG